MKTMTFEQAVDKGFIELLLDGARGIYLPQEFAQSFVVREAELDEDMACCAAGPDQEFYWESWENILDSGTIEGASGHVWALYQDGDLWAIREDAAIDWDA